MCFGVHLCNIICDIEHCHLCSFPGQDTLDVMIMPTESEDVWVEVIDSRIHTLQCNGVSGRIKVGFLHNVMGKLEMAVLVTICITNRTTFTLVSLTKLLDFTGKDTVPVLEDKQVLEVKSSTEGGAGGH